MVENSSGPELLQCERKCEPDAVIQRVRLSERVPEQVQILHRQLPKISRQHGELIVGGGEKTQLSQSADVKGQLDELVVVQFEGHQLTQLAEGGGQQL